MSTLSTMNVPDKPFYSRDPRIVAERILEAAEAEFMVQGFTATRTSRVVELFGGSKATLFRHFPSKADLFLAVIRRIGERLMAEVDVDALATDDPDEWLTAFARMALTGILRDDAMFVARMVVAEGRTFPAIRETFMATAVTPMLTLLAERLGAWNAAGRVVCDDPSGDAIAFFDLAMGGWINRALFGLRHAPDPAFAPTQAVRAVGLFLDGRRPRE